MYVSKVLMLLTITFPPFINSHCTTGAGYGRDKLNIDFNFVRCFFPVSEETHLIPFPISDW